MIENIISILEKVEDMKLMKMIAIVFLANMSCVAIDAMHIFRKYNRDTKELFRDAIITNNREQAMEFLHQDPNLISSNDSGEPFIHRLLFCDTYNRNLECDHLAAANLLLELGADVNIQNINNGNTPLHQAVLYESIDQVQLLLNRNADINAVNNEGKTADDITSGPHAQAIRDAIDAARNSFVMK